MIFSLISCIFITYHFNSPQNEFFASRVLRSTFGAMCMFLEIISSSGVIFHDGASDLFERISSSIENILRSSSTSLSHIRLFRVKLFDCLQMLASEIKQVPNSSSGNSSMFVSSQVPSLIRVIVSTCQRHLRLFGVQSSSGGNGRAFIEHSRVFKGVDDSIDSIQAASTDFNHLFKLSDKLSIDFSLFKIFFYFYDSNCSAVWFVCTNFKIFCFVRRFLATLFHS